MLVTGGEFGSKQHGTVSHDFFTGLDSTILRFEPDGFGILEGDTDLALDELARSRFNENRRINSMGDHRYRRQPDDIDSL